MLFFADEDAPNRMPTFLPELDQVNKSAPAKVRSSDILAIGIICAIAFVLRAWKFTTLGLTHYDEGAYVLSGYWSLGSFGSLYPWQKFFSPPGYFGLVGIIYWLAGGASDLIAIGINVFFGAATIVLVWWVGQRWFGRRAGIFSATLVAFNEFQIIFSRTALTDTLFGFTFLLSLAAIALCFEKQRPALAIFAGVAAGAAWNVKYHGWLLFAIAFVALVLPAAVKKPPDATQMKKIFLYWSVVTGVAAVCFLPWVLFTEYRLGGYLAVEKFHHRYLNFHWIANFARQVEFQAYFDGWLGHVSPALAFIAANVTEGIPRFLRSRILLAGFLGMLVAGLTAGGTVTWLLLALYGLAPAWSRGQELGRLVVTAFLVFLVLIPCYTPFARLPLPWVLVAQVLAGVAIEDLLEGELPIGNLAISGFWKNRKLVSLSIITVLALLKALVLGLHTPKEPGIWAPTSGSRDAAARLMTDLPKDSVVFVTAEPNLAFYFQRAGYHTFCIQHLAFNAGAQDPIMYKTTSPVYVIGGKYAREESDWLPILEAVPGRFRLVTRVAMEPSVVRLLDDKSPRETLAFKEHPDSSYDLELFRLNSSPKP